MTEITVGLIIALLFAIAWVGGSHTGMRQCRQVSQAHVALVDENAKLKREIEELRSLIFSLQSQLELYKKQVDALSAEVAINRAANQTTHRG